MWADAQRDGRPAEYRWRPLLNVATIGLFLHFGLKKASDDSNFKCIFMNATHSFKAVGSSCLILATLMTL